MGVAVASNVDSGELRYDLHRQLLRSMGMCASVRCTRVADREAAELEHVRMLTVMA